MLAADKEVVDASKEIDADFKAARDSLPPESALVAYVRYDRTSVKPPAATSPTKPGTLVVEPAYAALVWPKTADKPVLVGLASSDVIDV